MPQNVFIVQDPLSGEFVADPYTIQIFTNDQEICWKILVPGLSWSRVHPGGPIQFYPGWMGSTPEGIGPAPPDGEPDTRIYTCNGPGPTGTPESKQYGMFVVDADNNERHVGRALSTSEAIYIDPDVWNQPQP